MFLTHLQAQEVNEGLFDDLIAWRYVEHSIHRLWFYVATVEKNDDFDLRPMMMVSDVQLLQALLADQETGLKVEGILLVTPHHMNHSGRWMMEPLISIDKHETPRSQAYVYAVEGGRSYVDGNPDTPKRKDAKQKPVFRTDMLYSRASSSASV